jgi:hypothetical protein
MKRSDFIPDEELRRLLQLAEDAPKAITDQSKLAYECNREAIDNLTRDLEIIKVEAEWDINTAKSEDGKLRFTNATGRKSELDRQLLKDDEYQSKLKEKAFLETQRQQKFSQYYQDKDTFKAVLKKLGMAKALQETENLTKQLQIIESERSYVESKT